MRERRAIGVHKAVPEYRGNLHLQGRTGAADVVDEAVVSCRGDRVDRCSRTIVCYLDTVVRLPPVRDLVSCVAGSEVSRKPVDIDTERRHPLPSPADDVLPVRIGAERAKRGMGRAEDELFFHPLPGEIPVQPLNDQRVGPCGQVPRDRRERPAAHIGITPHPPGDTALHQGKVVCPGHQHLVAAVRDAPGFGDDVGSKQPSPPVRNKAHLHRGLRRDTGLVDAAHHRPDDHAALIREDEADVSRVFQRFWKDPVDIEIPHLGKRALVRGRLQNGEVSGGGGRNGQDQTEEKDSDAQRSHRAHIRIKITCKVKGAGTSGKKRSGTDGIGGGPVAGTAIPSFVRAWLLGQPARPGRTRLELQPRLIRSKSDIEPRYSRHSFLLSICLFAHGISAFYGTQPHGGSGDRNVYH